MPLSAKNLPQQIRDFKASLQNHSRHLPDYWKARFDCFSSALQADLDRIEALEEVSPGSSIPHFDCSHVLDNDGFTSEEANQIRRAGCCILRNTLPAKEVIKQNDALSKYIMDNGYYGQITSTNGNVKDDYFSQLDSDKPQIFGIYWSPAQIWARQHPAMASVRQHLNGIWDFNTEEEDEQTSFRQGQNDPSKKVRASLTYADRIRRREPGDASLGLSPHVDSGSIERWIEQNYRHGVYSEIFGTGSRISWDPATVREEYTPSAYQTRHRMKVEEIPSPAVCSIFRTFQGWLALTPQGAGDGTLQLLPSILAMPYILLRALQDDVAHDDLCGAAPGRALTVSPVWHPLLYGPDGKSRLVSIPKMQPGDTVWWHPDTVHGVENKHQGNGYSNVLYIAAVPDCDKNRAFLPRQRDAFLQGKSCPDFASENYEQNYEGRPGLDDLTPLGKRQMGFVE